MNIAYNIDCMESMRQMPEKRFVQQDPAKLDRSRWTQCEYCKSTPFWGSKYCYKCGRPFTEDAWAELERRINDGKADG